MLRRAPIRSHAHWFVALLAVMLTSSQASAMRYVRQYGDPKPEPAPAAQVVRETEETEQPKLVFMGAGLGISGFSAPRITDQALPGLDYYAAGGLRLTNFAMEFGLNGGGYQFDPEEGGLPHDLSLIGAHLDFRFQPTFAGFIEPWIGVGLQALWLADSIAIAGASGGGFRFSAGLDLRFGAVAARARFQHAGYTLGDPDGVYGGAWAAQAESVNLGVLYYF